VAWPTVTDGPSTGWPPFPKVLHQHLACTLQEIGAVRIQVRQSYLLLVAHVRIIFLFVCLPFICLHWSGLEAVYLFAFVRWGREGRAATSRSCREWLLSYPRAVPFSFPTHTRPTCFLDASCCTNAARAKTECSLPWCGCMTSTGRHEADRPTGTAKQPALVSS